MFRDTRERLKREGFHEHCSWGNLTHPTLTSRHQGSLSARSLQARVSLSFVQKLRHVSCFWSVAVVSLVVIFSLRGSKPRVPRVQLRKNTRVKSFRV